MKPSSNRIIAIIALILLAVLVYVLVYPPRVDEGPVLNDERIEKHESNMIQLLEVIDSLENQIKYNEKISNQGRSIANNARRKSESTLPTRLPADSGAIVIRQLLRDCDNSRRRLRNFLADSVRVKDSLLLIDVHRPRQ